MKVISKMKKFDAIKVDDSREFYFEIGKYLRDEEYALVNGNGYHPSLKLVCGDNEINLKESDYILISEDGKNVSCISKDDFQNDFIEIKEDK